MSDKSAIQWTDATWNPTTGCTKVSPGCANCYIERTPAFRIKGRKFVKGATDLRLHADRLEEPLKWRDPRRVFVNSLSDLFHEEVPDQFIVDVFGIMALAHQHTFQILTKRPDRMRAFLAAGDHGILRQFMLLQQNGGISTRRVFSALARKRRDGIEWRWPLPNVWLGVSVENQRWLERIDILKDVPAAVRFVSFEPLLEDLGAVILDGIDWAIIGGESGPGSRPFNLAWARDLVQQCRQQRVACFVKQLGAKPIAEPYSTHGWVWPPNGPLPFPLHDLKGGDPSEWPDDLRVREFPAVPA